MLVLWLTTLSTLGASELPSSVLRLRAIDSHGGVKLGSAVAIGPERVVTACHVTRDAQTIELQQDARWWPATAQVGSVAHDLCILTVPGLAREIAHRRGSAALRIGDRVTAVGYPGDRNELVVHDGTVLGLYEFDGGRVIRTDAAFDFGASGGGLFDADANLVGVLAFKARSSPSARFALPSEWIADGGAMVRTSQSKQAAMDRAFWEQPEATRPEFLGLALRESLSPRR